MSDDSNLAPVLLPSSPEELAASIREHPRVVITGAGTKPGLGPVEDGRTRIGTSRLTRLIEYEPDEFVVTAEAGMPVAELASTLARHGQHLPFDPLLASAGATLGGTVAAGFSGPGRFRHGGIRDFILGVRFVDGTGRLLRAGGRVVKNAAGFDIPKFLVGSVGRFAAIAEVTFKVFPRPSSSRTVRLATPDDPGRVASLIAGLGRGRWELEAVELDAAGPALFARISGPESAVDALTSDLLGRHPGNPLEPAEATELWRRVDRFEWSPPDSSLLKAPMDLARLTALLGDPNRPRGARVWIGGGGQVAWIALPNPVNWDATRDWLGGLGMKALLWRGPGPILPHAGSRPMPTGEGSITQALKVALDPVGRFPAPL